MSKNSKVWAAWLPVRSILFALTVILASGRAPGQQTAAGVPLPDGSQIPEWAQQGKFRFTRLDGGPIEILKTARSAWGMHFSATEKEVLGNLYTRYADRIIDLLEQAHINYVWLTWSVGYSWQDESEQRRQVQEFVAKLRRHGIRSGAYVCAVSMFWESMFRDQPRSVRWITFDPEGVPYRYSGGKDPLRFLADVANPEWVELQKRRVGAAIDAGFDSLFFDNTAAANWASDERIDEFVGKIRRFIHDERRSNLLLFTNYGLTPSRAALNRNMDFVFAEGWREPGVWGTEWNVSNIRRTKYLRGVMPPWKPLATEYSIFHEGNRATTFLGARSQRLATAEAAALDADYCWDMEGPFDAALIEGAPKAMESWQAIAQYNRFLREHENLYWKARSVAPIAVVGPATQTSFTWDRGDTDLYDLLAKHSILFDIRPLDEALKYPAAVISPRAGRVAVPPGGHVYAPAPGASPEEILARIRALAPDSLSVAVERAPNVFANVMRLGSGKGLAIHVLNYNPSPAPQVLVRIRLGREWAGLAAAAPCLFTPDSEAATAVRARRVESGLELAVSGLDVYSVVTLER
jgi:hypothetical protein